MNGKFDDAEDDSSVPVILFQNAEVVNSLDWCELAYLNI